MAIQIYKPTTPGRRQTSVMKSEHTDKVKPLKGLLAVRKRNGGRNNQGKITVRHQGGGAKRKLRLVDFKGDKFDIPAEVLAIEYDPYRSARIALVKYSDGEKRYLLAFNGIKVGDQIISSRSAPRPLVISSATLFVFPVLE